MKPVVKDVDTKSVNACIRTLKQRLSRLNESLPIGTFNARMNLAINYLNAAVDLYNQLVDETGTGSKIPTIKDKNLYMLKVERTPLHMVFIKPNEKVSVSFLNNSLREVGANLENFGRNLNLQLNTFVRKVNTASSGLGYNNSYITSSYNSMYTTVKNKQQEFLGGLSEEDQEEAIENIKRGTDEGTQTIVNSQRETVENQDGVDTQGTYEATAKDNTTEFKEAQDKYKESNEAYLEADEKLDAAVEAEEQIDNVWNHVKWGYGDGTYTYTNPETGETISTTTENTSAGSVKKTTTYTDVDGNTVTFETEDFGGGDVVYKVNGVEYTKKAYEQELGQAESKNKGNANEAKRKAAEERESAYNQAKKDYDALQDEANNGKTHDDGGDESGFSVAEDILYGGGSSSDNPPAQGASDRY